MSFFEKLSNYLTSNFFNSSRLKNHKLGNLRLLFERNNKFAETIANLGNVYRNSKWSDLKNQNIKNSFINRRGLLITIFVLLLVVILLTFNLSFSRGLLSNFPLIETFYENSLDSIKHLSNKLSVYCSPLLMYLHWISQRIHCYLENLKLRVLGLHRETIKTRTAPIVNRMSSWRSYLSTNSPKIAFSSKHGLCLIWAESSYYLKNFQQSISFFKNDRIPNDLTGKVNLTQLFLDTQYPMVKATTFDGLLSTKLPKLWEPTLLSELESSYTPAALGYRNYKLSQNTQKYSASWYSLCTNYSQVLNLGDINRVGLYTQTLSPHNVNTMVALSLAKQDRWLMRNSLVSDHIGNHNNAFTQAKKLLGTNLILSDSTNTNIWLSTKLNRISLLDSLSTSANLLESLYPTISPSKTSSLTNTNHLTMALTNLDFIEASRLWTTKKYFLSNNYSRSSYSLTPTNPQADLKAAKTSSNTSIFDVLVATQTLTLDNNLRDLLITLDSKTSTPLRGIENSVVDAHYLTSDLDALVNEDLSFVTTLTSNYTRNKTLYCFNSVKVSDFLVDESNTKL